MSAQVSPVASLLEDKTFTTAQEKVAYKRYLTVFDRTVRVECAVTGVTQDVHYDIVGHPQCEFKSVQTLPFHSAKDGREAQVTLIREYCQGPNGLCWNLPSGGFDPSCHKTLADCARAELSEEARLHGGELIQLVPDGHPGFHEVKWCANRSTPFLVIDPEEDPDPGARDAEEHIHIERVSIPRLKQLMANGEMMIPSIMAARLALDVLQERGLL